MELNFDKVCDLLKAHGIAAYTEMTGGGCATIYARREGQTGREVTAGPGWFDGPRYTLPRGSSEEFSVGQSAWDENGNEWPDEGYCATADPLLIDDHFAAEMIAAFVRMLDRVASEVEA